MNIRLLRRNAEGGISHLSDFLPFIVIGITTGAVYRLAGVGLMLTYSERWYPKKPAMGRVAVPPSV